jgi:hypothetical protein
VRGVRSRLHGKVDSACQSLGDWAAAEEESKRANAVGECGQLFEEAAIWLAREGVYQIQLQYGKK